MSNEPPVEEYYDKHPDGEEWPDQGGYEEHMEYLEDDNEGGDEGGGNPRLPVFMGAVGVGILLIAIGTTMRVGQVRKTEEIALAATMTAAVTDTPTPANTSVPTGMPTETPTETPTFPVTVDLAISPTATVVEPPSPTPVPAKTVVVNPTYATPAEGETESTIPPPVDPVKVPPDVVNILLVGTDTRSNNSSYNTDTMIVVSINKRAGTVNMLSIPRDLWVYIPGWQMNRVNTAYPRGLAVGWAGGGAGLLKETLLYNFGITIHYYARVDFLGFEDVVDTIGGVDVPVDCAFQFNRLIEPRKRPEDFPTWDQYVNYTDPESGNWEAITLDVGVHHLDGHTALRYARTRTGTTDFDRARRQQQVLRAILDQAQTLGLLNVGKVPQLWQAYGDLVETDMGLGNMLQLAPIAGDIDSSKIRSYIITPEYLTYYKTPEGYDVYIPNQDAIAYIVGVAMQPPEANIAAGNTATVEIRNGTAVDRLDEVAADRLGWEGLLTYATGFAPEGTGFAKTVIYDFTGRNKSSQLQTLQRILRVADTEIYVQPDPNRQVDYIVILGSDYKSCTYASQKQTTPTPIPPPASPTEEAPTP